MTTTPPKDLVRHGVLPVLPAEHFEVRAITQLSVTSVEPRGSVDRSCEPASQGTTTTGGEQTGMNQTHTDRMRDAAKNRRVYVRKLVGLGLLGGSFAVLAIGLFAWTVSTVWSDWAVFVQHWPIFYILFMPVIVITTLCYAVFATAWRESRSVLYVPPVAEQIGALPAEAILVRGSDEPAALPGEMLRAASAGKETKAEDLLRVTYKPDQRLEDSPNTLHGAIADEAVQEAQR